MKRFICFALIFVLSTVALAQSKRGPSTPEERARALQIAQTLEQDPLSKQAAQDREWLTLWLIDVPDITVSVCTVTLTWETKYKYAGELMAVQLAAQTAFIIQKPEDARNQLSVAQAGMESTLKAYAKILQQDAKAHSKKMDEIVGVNSKGELGNYLKTNWAESCK